MDTNDEALQKGVQFERNTVLGRKAVKSPQSLEIE